MDKQDIINLILHYLNKVKLYFNNRGLLNVIIINYFNLNYKFNIAKLSKISNFYAKIYSNKSYANLCFNIHYKLNNVYLLREIKINKNFIDKKSIQKTRGEYDMRLSLIIGLITIISISSDIFIDDFINIVDNDDIYNRWISKYDEAFKLWKNDFYKPHYIYDTISITTPDKNKNLEPSKPMYIRIPKYHYYILNKKIQLSDKYL